MIGPSASARRRLGPAMNRTARWAPLVLRLSHWGRHGAKVKSEVCVACKDHASTTTCVSETSSRRLSELDGVVSLPSSRGEDMPGVPDLPENPCASAGPDQITRQFLPVARSENWTTKDFEIVKTLGKGFMGLVLMVKLSNARGAVPYALKIIDKERVIREHMAERVMQEKELLSRASHPLIVRLFGTFQDDGCLFMLMECVGGGDLFSAMRNVRFNDGCAHFFAAEITLAIGHLHSLDIAYRDLKPENVAIDSLGHAKIIDFGLAKIVRTKTYTVCGTSEYMAPEVLTQVGHGRCVDWWALGILIFEMLSFQVPFTGRTATEIHKSVVSRDPRCPPYFGSATKGIVYLLLIKDQTLRLGSGADGGGRVQKTPVVLPRELGRPLPAEGHLALHSAARKSGLSPGWGGGGVSKGSPCCYEELKLGLSHCQVNGAERVGRSLWSRHLSASTFDTATKSCLCGTLIREGVSEIPTPCSERYTRVGSSRADRVSSFIRRGGPYMCTSILALSCPAVSACASRSLGHNETGVPQDTNRIPMRAQDSYSRPVGGIFVAVSAARRGACEACRQPPRALQPHAGAHGINTTICIDCSNCFSTCLAQRIACKAIGWRRANYSHVQSSLYVAVVPCCESPGSACWAMAWPWPGRNRLAFPLPQAVHSTVSLRECSWTVHAPANGWGRRERSHE
ncbi:unnamed protein product [Prorocentrum cordatum]|uniref:Protein kinase domain-containing protein n=1 Tax=Prorocentrum cordatum TaxID=2364126 RepID=A0ABN9X3C0_9DINO|nr:unnamed protein product [Polarella glacialis]